jgi:pyruvate formate lyase activating enzyme
MPEMRQCAAGCGMIFDIQHYAVHDGPGIRTLVFFKGCPLRCRWCCNPESQLADCELRHSRVRCRACFRCEQACPRDAVTRSDNGPVFDRDRCAQCPDQPCVDGCYESALSWIGRQLSCGELIAQVAADLPFYQNSGGGVTLSGGEPFAQPEFLIQMLRRCKALGIHTAVQTCGHGRSADLLAAEPLVDLFLYDLKLIDSVAHKALTGADNTLIVQNLRMLAARAARKITLRFPVIPGFTDCDENARGIAQLARELSIESVQLQPYHSLGIDKYQQLGRKPKLEIDPRALAPARIQTLIELFRDKGLRCEMG